MKLKFSQEPSVRRNIILRRIIFIKVLKVSRQFFIASNSQEYSDTILYFYTIISFCLKYSLRVFMNNILNAFFKIYFIEECEINV